MSLNDHLVAMSETQPWTSFALRGLSFQFLGLNFQFLEGNFKTSEPCVYKEEKCQMPRYSRGSYHQKGTRTPLNCQKLHPYSQAPEASLRETVGCDTISQQ